MYINKNTHEILFDVIPKGIDWVKVPNGTELIFKNSYETKDPYGFAKLVDGVVLLKTQKINIWTESKWEDFADIKFYQGNTIIWEKDLTCNVEKNDENKKSMHLVRDANGEYKVRNNTGEASDTFIMDLLDGVEVLTNYKGKDVWYQWKPSQNMTDNKDGKWEECGYGFDTYDEYLKRNKDDLTIIDLRVATKYGADVFDHGVNTDSGYTRDAVHVHMNKTTNDSSCNEVKYIKVDRSKLINKLRDGVISLDFSEYEGDNLVKTTAHDAVHDVVHQPKHYTEDPSGVECIQLTSLLPCCISNSLKYLWRCGKKDEDLQELKKALFYINYSIEHHLPSFIQGVSDTLEFEKLIKQVKEYWNGDKYMFIDALYWGDQPTMKRAIENMISSIENINV